MEKEKIQRINELARKKKSGELTPSEAEEQAALRAEYLAEFRKGMQSQLDAIVIQEPDGTKHHLRKK